MACTPRLHHCFGFWFPEVAPPPQCDPMAQSQSSKIKQVHATARPYRRACFFLWRSRQILDGLPLLKLHHFRPPRLRILGNHLHVPRLAITRAIPEARWLVQALPP